jgi:acyl-CoA synthetase (AMP-forming)/AMP-acid ligase II
VTSIGYPSSGTECELREGTHSDEGVLYMRSPMVMEGYHKLNDKTAEVLIDGWYRSGDVMRRDAEGFFHFLGRNDDMFVVGGENVWPGHIEDLIEMMPAVHQAAVVAVGDDIKGSVPFAFVVCRPGAQLTEADVKAFAIKNGPAFAHPRFVELVDEIAISGTNKPDKGRLRIEAETIAKARRANRR